MGVAAQFIGRGDSVGHTCKVHTCRLGCFGIHCAVANVEYVLLLYTQTSDGKEEAFGVGFGAGDIFSTHHNVQKIGGQVLVQ